MTTINTENLISVSEFAKLKGVSVTHVHRWMKGEGATVQFINLGTDLKPKYAILKDSFKK